MPRFNKNTVAGAINSSSNLSPLNALGRNNNFQYNLGKK